MSNEHIRQATQQLASHFASHPQDAVATDKPAVAVIEAGLRCRVEGPGGAQVTTDMPKPIGGGASTPTPGWFFRAALASCDATMIALRAAQLGITLSRLEVSVDSQSDNRGLLGMDEALPGPLSVRVRVNIAADGATGAQLQELVHWAEAHSPVGDTVRRAVTCTTDVAVGPG